MGNLDTDIGAIARAEIASRRTQAYASLTQAREMAQANGLSIEVEGGEGERALYYIIKTPMGDIDWHPARQVMDASDVPKALDEELMKYSPDQPKSLLAAVAHIACAVRRVQAAAPAPASLFGETGQQSALVG